MSINNLENTLENNRLLYCNLYNDIIIECICLTESFKIYDCHYNQFNCNGKIKYFKCDTVKIITIYDIYKNIIYEPIQTDLFIDPIKMDGILKNLIEIYYFSKTFIGSFIIRNKINNIKYNIYRNGNIRNIFYDNIKITLFTNAVEFNIYNNNTITLLICTVCHYYDNIDIHGNSNSFNIYSYEKEISIHCNIFNNYIVIKKINHAFKQVIIYNKDDLKIIQIEEYYLDLLIYREERNDNNEIIILEKYDNTGKVKENYVSNNINIPFSKPLKDFCTEFFNYYNKYIYIYITMIKTLFKKKKKINNILSLKYNLEMIYSK